MSCGCAVSTDTHPNRDPRHYDAGVVVPPVEAPYPPDPAVYVGQPRGTSAHAAGLLPIDRTPFARPATAPVRAYTRHDTIHQNARLSGAHGVIVQHPIGAPLQDQRPILSGGRTYRASPVPWDEYPPDAR